jgi:NADPH:quinone reductase
MKHTRIIVTHYGGPDALQALEEECPEPRQGEARVRVLAAGVSLPDLLKREDVHPETPRLPFTLGWGIWLAWWIGSGLVSLESNQTR